MILVFVFFSFDFLVGFGVVYLFWFYELDLVVLFGFGLLFSFECFLNFVLTLAEKQPEDLP